MIGLKVVMTLLILLNGLLWFCSELDDDKITNLGVYLLFTSMCLILGVWVL